jgi:hypothetical protein
MEEPLQMQEPPPDAPPSTGMSLAGRLFNIFATPGDVFQDVKTARASAANWVAPALILIVVSWAASVLIFSQASIMQQFSEIVDQGIQKQVQSRHMTEQQAEQSRAVGEKWSIIVAKIGAGIIPVLAGFGTPFVWGLFLWLVGAKVLKGDFPYMKAVEVVGLGNMIGVLETIVKTLLIVGLGDIYATPSLALLVKGFDPQNTVHALLTIVNVMTFWVLVVRAIGLARLSGASFAKAALWVFGIWAAYTGFFFALGQASKLFFKRFTG